MAPPPPSQPPQPPQQPPLKKHYLSLLLLITLFTLFLISHYTLSPPSPSLSTATTTAPHFPPPQKFTLTLKVLTFDRLSSLTRCLHSLSSAHYSGDTVHLHIYIDHFVNSSISSDVGQKLETFEKIVGFVDGFEWIHGLKFVHSRVFNAGLQAQWLEAWWPVDDHDFAFVVEDDVEVSPLYYQFLKKLILNYYYNHSNFSPLIFGASLQRPRFVPGKHGNKMNLDSESKLFLYQLVGTWGQLLFPRPWKEFRLWYNDHKARGIKPFLEGMVTNGWYKKMGERIWTPWFIKFIHSRGYFNIYTNFPHERALSVSHRDAGVNYGKSIGPDSQLIDDSRDIDLLDMLPLRNMQWYDFCFRKVLSERVVKKLDEVDRILHTMNRQKPILLISVSETSEKTIRNLICHFERLNIRNYIFMVAQRTSHLLLDLPRRGHPVIDIESVFDSITQSKSTHSEIIRDIVVKAYVIKKCLESRFDAWVISGNVLPLSDNALLASDGSANDFYVGKGSRYFVARSSSSSQKIWGETFVQKLGNNVESLVGHDDGDFVAFIEKFFGNVGLRLTTVDETGFGLKLETADLNQSVTSNTKMISWSPTTDIDLVRERLERLGMWIIDADSSCKAVVCHQS
ncbi:hypothetical protein RND81_09G252700 [Saponaria officinalis]|uniref:Uncharacterized protein n=1 Tax=Saponaria officinalis TaxID=3572 RepID=A0AAW1IRW5_SAPOF